MKQKIKEIVINTNYQDHDIILIQELSSKFKKNGIRVTFNDWEYKKNYDLAIFTAADSEIIKIKDSKPQITAGIFDPKIQTSKQISEVKAADFVLVSSIEQRERFQKYNSNIHIYYMFPEMKAVYKKHHNHKKIIIGYHGNKLHLIHFEPEINNALKRINKQYPIELYVMYNYPKLGYWQDVPDGVEVKHIPWSVENYYRFLSRCDIGLVPNIIPINQRLGLLATRKRLWEYEDKYGYNINDYLIRFKYSTNPGRVYVFAQLGIPVISDFAPSINQLIKDNEYGIIVNGEEGWYRAIKKLIEHPDLRQIYSDNIRGFINNTCSPDINYINLINFLKTLKK